MTDAPLDITRIYYEPAAAELPRGKEILERFPDAARVEVESHNRIPELYGDETNVRRWVRIKREALVLGVKKSLTARPNGRSADFIAPSTANGCAMACAYCYVPRHKGYSNPITVFANIERIAGYLGRHAGRQGAKPAPNECDPHAWVYDIGENSDCSLDARISDNVRDLVDLFRTLPNAKASFATKHVNRDLLGWDPAGRTRIRFSLMPQADAKVLDIRTSPIAERIAAIDDFVAAGYEVHVNFSPVVVREGWLDDWAELLD
ncbi:spore photoproduct lyase family protein [Actinoplanes sp. NPDC051633]|uniref:spore photoproduct lyase family protein n=1 Tax=Actinoplanes sp. NPDC051633 TaxID=3155670 RepID=UPI0034478084